MVVTKSNHKVFKLIQINISVVVFINRLKDFFELLVFIFRLYLKHKFAEFVKI